MQIRLGGLTFDGGPGKVRYTVARDALQGWIGKGGPGVKRKDSPRPLAHGSAYQRGFRTGRLITWHGQIHTDSPADQDEALAELSSILAEGEQGRITVQSAMGTHWCDVQLDDEPDVKRLTYGKLASYSVGFWSNDPEIYGVEPLLFAPGEVEQRGNFRAVADAIVTGPVAAPYTLAVGDRQFVVTQPLTAGQVHTIDTRRARVYRNGVQQGGVFSKAQSLIVRKGPPQTFTGPASARLLVVDTFI